ncbi:unnamed protein product [Arabidopsis halleri]
MAVRNTKAAHVLIQIWQDEWSGKGLPLNLEVKSYTLTTLCVVVKSHWHLPFDIWAHVADLEPASCERQIVMSCGRQR